MLAAPTVADLAQFTGRGNDSFSAFADQTLAQATLLFSLITHRTAYPDDPALAALAKNAIMEMASRMYLEQGYAETLASPFQSETIGSYSYSKSLTATKAQNGLMTGLLWWDLAIDELTQVLDGNHFINSGSIGGGFETMLGADASGRHGIRNPADDVDPPYVRIS